MRLPVWNRVQGPCTMSQSLSSFATCSLERLPVCVGRVARLRKQKIVLIKASSVEEQRNTLCRGSRCSNVRSRTATVTRAQQATTSNKTSPSLPAMGGNETVVRSNEQVRRLSTLVGLRGLYQDLLRAELLLAQGSPVYEPLTQEDQEGLDEEEVTAAQGQRVLVAIEIVGEMQLTAEELGAGLRALPQGFGAVYDRGQEVDSERRVRERVMEVAAQLKERASKEVELLPFPSKRAAQAAVDVRNSRYTGRSSPADSMDETVVATGEVGPDGLPRYLPISSKLGAAEKAAEKFVQMRLTPAVKKVRESSPKDWVGNLQAGATYARGLWDRLNGGEAGKLDKRLPQGLSLPSSTKEERQAVISSLSIEVSSLEKQLQECSKAREAKLRKVDISMRARMASELRKLDDEVSSLSRALAVRTLQLEMEYIYGSLEDEALDNCVGKPEGLAVLGRSRGADDDLALLAAEFGLLDESLAALGQLVDRGSAVVINEDELLTLATDVPDLRVRLGITDGDVFGGNGFSVLKVQLQLKEAVRKVQEGVDFGSRGVRLLGSDVVTAMRFFWRAALGDTLKPREVQSLRRTVRDLLTFVPFTVILIAPITPIGHVLVFGFIQRYFPGFFPSQFTSRRQEIMTRYEQLQNELRTAQEQAVEAAEQQELAQAAAAVARLTAPRMAPAMAGQGDAAAQSDASAQQQQQEQGVSDSVVASSNSSDADARVQQLQQAVAQVEEEALLNDSGDDEGGSDEHQSQQQQQQRNKSK